jgi:hypothetical protein
MRKSFLAVGVAGLLVVAGLGSALVTPALAQSSLTVHPRKGIPLPSYVTSSDDWLNPGNVQTPGEVDRSNNYSRLVQDPIGNIVPVGPDLGPMPWN